MTEYTPSEPATDHGGFYGAGAHLLNAIPTATPEERAIAERVLVRQPDAHRLLDMFGLGGDAA